MGDEYRSAEGVEMDTGGTAFFGPQTAGDASCRKTASALTDYGVIPSGVKLLPLELQQASGLWWWYLHTQNPPRRHNSPARYPYRTARAVLQPPQSSPTAAPSGRSSTSEDQTPISWQPDFQMNWYSGPQMAWIRFVGKSTTLAHIKDAYIVSKLTGHREPLEVANATNFNERWNVNQIEPIPPGATTMLVYGSRSPHHQFRTS